MIARTIDIIDRGAFVAKTNGGKTPTIEDRFDQAFASIDLDGLIDELIASVRGSSKSRGTKKDKIKPIQIDETIARRLVIVSQYLDTTVANVVRPLLETCVAKLYSKIAQQIAEEVQDSEG